MSLPSSLRTGRIGGGNTGARWVVLVGSADVATCRLHYADVLVWRGAWADAEEELVLSVRTVERRIDVTQLEGDPFNNYYVSRRA
jgi:hypothetical protein